MSAGRAFTNGSGAMAAYPVSSCTYRESGVYNLSAMITEMWGCQGGETKKLISWPVCKANHSVTSSARFTPSNPSSSTSQLMYPYWVDRWPPIAGHVGGLRGSAWQRLWNWIVFPGFSHFFYTAEQSVECLSEWYNGGKHDISSACLCWRTKWPLSHINWNWHLTLLHTEFESPNLFRQLENLHN